MGNCGAGCARLFAEQINVGAGPYKVDDVALDLIDQQEAAADMAFPVIGPGALERMIAPFRVKRRIAGDQQDHRLLKTALVVAAGA